LRHVDPGSPDECWLWQGSIKPAGYGQLTVGNKLLTAHRVSWEIYNGPIPDGLWVLHRCEGSYLPGDITSRRCVNPAHLYLGTPTDNAQDVISSGRIGYSGSPGQAHPGAKLNESAVMEIRRQWARNVSQSEMARQFGVSQNTVWAIVHRRSWAHLP
jgi:hypothetical protein